MVSSKIKKVRGVLLSLLLVFNSYIFLRTILNFNYFSNPVYPAFIFIFVPSWYIRVSVVLTVLSFIYLIGLWTWKKWGVYAYILSRTIFIFFNLAVLKLTQTGLILIATIEIVMDVLVFWAIHRKWKYFD